MLANAVGQLPLCRLTPRIRQQAGSYQFSFAFGFVASVRACVNPLPVLDRGGGARTLSSARMHGRGGIFDEAYDGRVITDESWSDLNP